MGLDLYCNGVSQKVGSYTNVQKIRYLLLAGIKYYLEMEHDEHENEIHYIMSLMGKRNQVLYNNYSHGKTMELGPLKVKGLFSFILHSDSDGTLCSYEAKEFLKSWNIVKDYMDEELKDYDDNFYLHSVFQESVDSDETITFC